MVLTSIRDLRKSELLIAACRVLMREGIGGTTADMIAAEAGAAKGLVHHYFPSKRELVLAAIRHAHGERRLEIVNRLKSAASPWDRLNAIIDVELGETYLSRQHAGLWIATAVEALNDPEFARLQNVIRRREASNLRHALRRLVPPDEVDEFLLAIRALIEACRLWVGYIGWYDWQHAIALARAMLAARVPQKGSDR